MTKTKTIDTLVEDIYSVIKKEGGWTKTINEEFKTNIGNTAFARFGVKADPLSYGGLRMSNIGQPCRRKLWYSCNLPQGTGEELQPHTLFKFSYGAFLEDVVIALAKAAGHTVTGEQDRMEIHGIVGHRDCVIDGITVDVKSASTYGFKKFKEGGLRDDDPFGYISQLSNYVYAAKEDPLVINKTDGAFLAIDKGNGHICLDTYDFTPELSTKEYDILATKIEVNNEKVTPDRAFEPVPDGKSGNTKLPINCSYCDFKNVCHPTLRTFLYSTGPRHLVDVVKEPYNKWGPIKEVVMQTRGE